jgi:hypothetical protein
MQTISKRKSWKSSPSFALISVLALVSLAALTATAFLASARLERQATSSIGNATRLEMALDSGKICASQVIGDNTQPDVGNTHIILYWRTNWTDELGYPFIGQIKASNTASWYYFPLFSPAGLTNLDTNNYQTAMRFTNTHQGAFSNEMQSNMATKYTNTFVANPGLNHPTCVQIPLLGGRTSPPVGWVYLHQEKRKLGSNLTNTSPVVRIAWFTEDLEGLIDAERMGATTSRSTGTNAEEVSLASASDSSGALIASVANFTNNRKAYISYGLLSSTSVSGLANPTNARYFASGLRSWAPTNAASPTNGALAWIPVGIPVGGTNTAPLGYSNQGYTKFNLNNLATNSGPDPVATIARVITSNLSTNFLARAGGLTNNNRFDYAKCIAANIVDYIDSDSTPSIQTGINGYRGCEALPLVSEVAIGIQWTNQTQGGIFNEEFEVTPVIELWNMYNKTYTGTLSFAYNCSLEIGKGPSAGLGSSPALCLTQTPTTGSITNSFSVSLEPNEYRVFIMPSRGYSVVSGIGASSKPLYNTNRYWTNSTNAFATNMASLMCGRPGRMNSDNFSSFWELAVGGVVYDRTTSIEEASRTMYCEPYATKGRSDAPPTHLPEWPSHVPSLRLDPGPTGSLYGTGDPRMTWFMTNSTTANGPGIMNSSGLDESGSFGYRNRIWAYSAGSGDERKGSTNRPDLWLDGGHAGSTNGPGPKPGGFYKVTDPRWTTLTNRQSYTNQPCAFIADGPMRNITELGNIFDPIQYETAVRSTSANKQPTYPTNITTTSLTNWQQGGGNTLRIGRAEHQRFAFTNIYNEATAIPVPNMGMSSAALLDLFCLTNGTSPNGGPYSLGGGKINLNTAPAPVLRALAGGILLTNDPAQVPANYTIPPAMAEAFAQSVMRFRSKYPFLTPSHLSFIGTDPAWPNTNSWPTNSVFGNTNTITLDTNAPGNTFGSTARLAITQSSDQAAEEWFSKIFALSSYQSHNFRIYVVAQLVATNSSGQTNAIGPLAKKHYQIYARNTNNSGITPTPNTDYRNNTIYTWTPAINTIDIHKSAY